MIAVFIVLTGYSKYKIILENFGFLDEFSCSHLKYTCQYMCQNMPVPISKCDI